MVEFLSKIAEFIKAGDMSILALSLFLWVISNGSKIDSFIERRKKVQIERLNEALNSAYLDEKSKKFLIAEIQKEYFLLFSTIRAEKQFRDKIFEVHDNANGNLPFHRFRQASDYLFFYDGKLSVKIIWWDRLVYFINWVLAVASLLMWFFLLIYPLFIRPFAIEQALINFGQSLFFFLMALYALVGVRSFRSAKLIEKELQKLDAN